MAHDFEQSQKRRHERAVLARCILSGVGVVKEPPVSIGRRKFAGVSGVVAGKITRRWTADELFEGLRPPTHDDVPVAVDGRVLDTPEKLIAYLDEINERRAGRVTQPGR